MKAANRVTSTQGKTEYSIDVAYCDSVYAEVMPFESVMLASTTRVSPYTADPAITGLMGPLLGATIDVAGQGFANTRFSKVSYQLLDAPAGSEWTDLTYTYVDKTHLMVDMPSMEYTGGVIDVVVRISNGGTAFAGIDHQTFQFTYEYTLGEDWVHELRAIYTFDDISWDATEHTWENVFDRASIPTRAKRAANYGMGGPFLTSDRDYLSNRGIEFSMGERVELPPLDSEWSMCMWLYAEEGSETLFYERDMHNHATRNVLMVDGDGKLALDGVSADDAVIRLMAWQFVCVSRSNSEVTFYVSGKDAGSAAMPPPSSTPVMAHAILGKMLLGKVDDLWVWGRELKDHEVESMYMFDQRAVRLAGTDSSYFSIESAPGVFDTTAWAPAANSPFTIQAWINPADVTGNQPIFQAPVPISTNTATTPAQDASAISHGIYVGLVDGLVVVILPIGGDGIGATKWGSAITEDPVVVAGAWTQVTVVYTNTRKLEIYINGVQVLLLAASQGPDTTLGQWVRNTGNAATLQAPRGSGNFGAELYTTATAGAIRIGYATTFTAAVVADTGSFRGSVGEVRLWSRGLSSTEAASTYTCRPQASDAGLYAMFLLTEATGSELMNYVPGVSVTMKYSDTLVPFWAYAAYGDMADTTVWPLSELAGGSTKLANAGMAGSFTFQDRAVCSKIKKVGGDSIQFALVGPLDRHSSVRFGACEDHTDGTYTCSYNTTLCGYYALRVEDASVLMEPGVYSAWNPPPPTPMTVLGVQGQAQNWIRTTANEALMAKGTPAKLYVHPGATWAPKSYVWDDPDWLEASDLQESQKGVPASFNLQAIDYWGCPRTVGGDLWDIKTYGRYYGYGDEWEMDGRVMDNGDGTYKLSYTPQITGHTQLSVMLNGEHVDIDAEADPHATCSWSLASDTHGSPWCIDVVPGQGSIAFDGINHATAPHSSPLTLDENWSVDVWVYPTKDAHGRIFSKQSPATGKGYWMGFVEGGNVEIGLYVGSENFRTLKSKYEVQPNRWTHLAVVYTGDSLKLYINGALSSTEAYEHSTEVRENNQPLVIGKGFQGLVDELRFWKEDISAQLPALWKCPAHPPSLAAYFSFNDGPAAVIAHDYFGIEAVLVGYNVTNNSAVDADFIPTWSAMHAPSNYGVVDFAASVAKSFTGEGLMSAIAGIPTTFSFRFWDMCGFDYVSDDIAVSATMVDDVIENALHDQLHYPMENTTVVTQVSSSTTTEDCTESSTFQAFYTAPTCGTMRLTVALDGAAVDGFPMDLPISPHPATSAEMSHVTDFNDAVTGIETSFTIVARDMFGCQRTGGGDQFDVQLTRTTLGMNPESIMFAGPDIVHQTLAPEDHGDGTYTVKYTVPAAGNYTIFIGLLDDDGTRSYVTGGDPMPLRFVASHAPWRSVHVEGAQPDPRYRSSTVKNDDYVYVFRGFSENKEGLMDIWRYPLHDPESMWLYRVPVTIGNAPSYAVRVTVDTATLIAKGKMREDCGDVLFKTAADAGWEGEAVPYMIDMHHTCGMATTIFWLVPTSESLFMFYGNPEAMATQLTPADLFLSWDDFEDMAAIDEMGLPTGWQFAETCSLPTGDPASFSLGGETIPAFRGSGSLQVDAKTRLGGALMKAIPAQTQYILRAAFYDSDAPASSQWISPNYDDCTPVPNAKEMLDQATGLGVYTPSTETSYTSLYPWLKIEDKRTAGWHMFEVVSDGEEVHFYVDDTLKLTRPAADPLNKVFLNAGGPDIDVPLLSMAAWDDILVARYDSGVKVTLGEESAVMYINKGFHQVYTHGTTPPPRTASAAAVYENKVYLLGGYGTYGSFANSGKTRGAAGRVDSDNVVWTYDLITKTYETQTPWGSARPSPRFEHTVTVCDESATIYLFGGRDAATGALLSDTWAYSITDMAWTNVSPEYGPSGRFSGASACYKNVVLTFGGLVNHSEAGLDAAPTHEIWAFHTLKGTWSDLTPTRLSPPARYGHAAAMHNGKMYVYGGYDNDSRLGDAWKYDVDYNRWTMLRADPGYDMPAEKSSLTAVAHDNLLIVFGGQESTDVSYASDMWSINIY